MADFTLKQGDSAIALTDTLTYSDSTAVNLTGASVSFVMRARSATTPKINAAATIVSPAAGTVSYTPSATDTNTAGLFAGYWKVTFSGGTIERFPTIGYFTVEIQENLETANQTIVELDDVKDYLNFEAGDRSHDGELMRFVYGVGPVVENLAGAILPKTFDEWYDGGQYWVRLRHRPVQSITSISEFRGPTEYVLTVVADPAHGDIYSAMLEGDGRVTRRTAGGGVQAFPSSPNSVHVVYIAGRSTIPENVRLGTLELIRINYQSTQQAGRRPFGADFDDELSNAPQMLGFFVPNRVRELLAPNRRAPSVA